MKLQIQVNSKDQAQFWIRVFKLEDEIERVRKMMDNAGPRKWAAVPVVSEYGVDDDLRFIYFLNFSIDALGANHCVGFVFVTDKENEAEIVEARDKIATHVLSDIEKRRHFDEIAPIERKKE
jgi:hypothetical protein